MQKAVIYVRGNNTAGQYLVCKEYCEAKGYEVVGGTDDLKEAITNTFDILVVLDESRISREAKEMEAFNELFADNGITVETAREHYGKRESENLAKHIKAQMK